MDSQRTPRPEFRSNVGPHWSLHSVVRAAANPTATQPC